MRAVLSDVAETERSCVSLGPAETRSFAEAAAAQLLATACWDHALGVLARYSAPAAFAGTLGRARNPHSPESWRRQGRGQECRFGGRNRSGGHGCGDCRRRRCGLVLSPSPQPKHDHSGHHPVTDRRHRFTAKLGCPATVSTFGPSRSGTASNGPPERAHVHIERPVGTGTNE